MTSPASGSTVSGTITVSADVSIIGSLLVGGVQFKLDGANLGPEDTTAPYSVPWNTTGASNGTHTLWAVARDALGLQFTSNQVTVTVSNAPPPDTTPPTVGITSPAAGATVSATIAVSASASDNAGVAGVQFLVDGAALGAEDTAAPWSVSWDTTTKTNGSHALTARARDAAGNTRTSTGVTVTVSNAPPPDTTPPTVGITSPGAGATVSGTITVAASASDTGGVAVTQFLVDGVELGRDTTAPYEMPWDTRTTADGTRTLLVRAQDTAGNIGESAPVTVTVSNGPPSDTTPPTVGITSPGAGATVSGTITVAASASDTGGVAVTQFLVDGVELGRDTIAPYEMPWDTRTTADGTRTLLVRAQDAAGNIGESAPVTVTVSNGPPQDTTRFEESAAALAPAGAWSEISGARAGATLSGDRAVFTATTGATASFAFSGTGVSWTGLPCEVCGIARVFVDGALAATVDTFVPSRPAASSMLFVASGLPAGSHTLVVEVTGTQNPSSGGANVVVDAFEVEGGTSGGGPSVTRIEETDPAVSFSAGWILVSRPDVSGGTAQKGADAGLTVTLSFNGTGVSWIGFKSPHTGIARVYIDGTLRATVDTYAPADMPQAVAFTASGLPAGPHTLMIEVTGTYTSSSCCAWIAVDAFDVTTDDSGPPPAADTTPPGTMITSPASGASLSGTVTVSANATDDVLVAGVQFFVDGAAIGTEDRTAPYSILWDTTGVADGSRSLTATARDTSGNSATSSPVTVTVSNGAPAAARSEESAAALAPPTAWFGLTSADTGVTLSGDFAVAAADTGATATFTFTGRGVNWIGFQCEKCGIARVSVDGSVLATVDTYAPSRSATSGVIFGTTGLAAGSHTLVIEVTGTGNSSSLGTFVAVDAFDVF